jgi:transcriptional regulator with XRE-family HTH domain
MDKKLAKRIGLKVRAAREQRGLSQAEFAEAASVTRGYLSDIERGAREVSVSTLVRLCRVTGLTPTRILAM